MRHIAKFFVDVEQIPTGQSFDLETVIIRTAQSLRRMEHLDKICSLIMMFTFTSALWKVLLVNKNIKGVCCQISS